MSIKALQDYTFYSRYSQYVSEKKRRETWHESVSRVFDMHRRKYADQLSNSKELQELLVFAEKQVLKKRVLGSQRALQYGGDPILNRNERMFNCSSLYIDKPTAFQYVVWLLLAGCGVGFSVQKQHIAKLPKITKVSNKEATFVVPDTCEGWADAVGVLLSSYFVDGGTFKEYKNKKVSFDFSLIRPKGSLIAGQFKAPGPEPLKRGLEKIRDLLDTLLQTDDPVSLKPITVYDILMHCSDFVIAGGLRRSAVICLFSVDDEEMRNAKIGNWFATNPQRARSNNSVVLKRDEVTREQFDEIFQSIRHFGEPGFFFVNDKDELTNPCCEILFYNHDKITGETGVHFCNLTEINGKFCDTVENFEQACEAAAIIGTLQAGYTEFPYLGEATQNIVKEEALLGVSITGWMDNPDVLFDEAVLKKAAKIVKNVNKKLAKLIGVNYAARLTCAKPAGHTSCILGTASGIHPHHAKRYIRNVQSNKQDYALQEFKKINPAAVQESVWSANNTDDVISFLCEVQPGAITKNQLSAIDLLEKVKLAQNSWVKFGVNDERNIKPGMSHNISNTITVHDGEWKEVESYIYRNRNHFTGISLLPASGDLDYSQAPFSSVLTPNELVREYGDASVFASGLVVDGLHAYGDLWRACDTVLDIGEDLNGGRVCPEYPKGRNNKQLAEYFLEKEEYDEWFYKADWVRRVKQFADRYFDGNVKRSTYCLKHVSLWKTWVDLKREYKDVNWEDLIEEHHEYKDADTMAAAACSGGKCEL